MTDVTIRGIDDDVYARFSAEAKKRGMPIGELTTMVMRALLDDPSSHSYRIGELVSLSVSRKDLESLDGMVTFCNIKSLEFEDDIDWETFDKHIAAIMSVAKVMIPSSLSRFQVFTKCRMVGKVLNKEG